MKGSIVSLSYIMIKSSKLYVQVFQTIQLLHIPIIVVLYHIHSHITSKVCCRHNMGAPITNEPPITSHQNNHQPQHWLITKNQQLNINHRDSAQRAMEIQYRGAKYIPDRINILSIKESVQLYLVSISRRSVNSVQLISHTVHFFFTSQDFKKNVGEIWVCQSRIECVSQEIQIFT